MAAHHGKEEREYEEGPDPLLFGDFVFPFLFSSQSKPVGAHGAGHLGGDHRLWGQQIHS